jgi:asparagine N-glycosylation enzyme membrane subunit Stt3
MATRVDLFLDQSCKAFEAEWQRCERLTGKAERYLAAVGVVVGFGLVSFDTAMNPDQPAASYLLLASLGTLSLSFLLALLALRTRDYWSYPDEEAVVSGVLETSIDYEEAQMKLAKMYFCARDTNSEINAKRARLLAAAGFLLVTGFVLAVFNHLATQG